MCAPELYPEHDLFIQLMKLKNTLRWLKGEDLITHLGEVLRKHAAELLGVSRRTVYYRIGDGKLRTVRTLCGSQRVLIESIEALLRQGVYQTRAPGAGASNRGLSERCPAP